VRNCPPNFVVPSGGMWNEDARPAGEPARACTTREAEGLRSSRSCAAIPRPERSGELACLDYDITDSNRGCPAALWHRMWHETK
jgi:hypothetical protein